MREYRGRSFFRSSFSFVRSSSSFVRSSSSFGHLIGNAALHEGEKYKRQDTLFPCFLFIFCTSCRLFLQFLSFLFSSFFLNLPVKKKERKLHRPPHSDACPSKTFLKSVQQIPKLYKAYSKPQAAIYSSTPPLCCVVRSPVYLGSKLSSTDPRAQLIKLCFSGRKTFPVFRS